MASKGKTGPKADTGANLGFEAKLWQMADGLRNNMDAAEYKHIVFGLIFLKYMRAFAAEWTDLAFVQQVAAQIHWFHNWLLLDRVLDPTYGIGTSVR